MGGISQELEDFKEYLENRLSINSKKTIDKYIIVVRAFLKKYKSLSQQNINKYLKTHRNLLYKAALEHYIKFKNRDWEIKIEGFKPAPKKPLPFEFEWQDFMDCISQFHLKCKKPNREKDTRWIILFGVFTGCRIHEILNIKVADLNKAEKTIIIIRKKGIPDKIKVPKMFDDFFEYVLEEKGLLPVEYCFYEDVKDRKVAYDLYQYYIKRSNLPEKYKWMLKRTHNWRRAVAMFILKQTGDIFKAKEVLRHRSINTTMIYVQEWMREKARKEGINILVENYTDEIEQIVNILNENARKEVDWNAVLESIK